MTLGDILGHSLVAWAGPALALGAAVVPWLVDQTENVVLIRVLLVHSVLLVAVEVDLAPRHVGSRPLVPTSSVVWLLIVNLTHYLNFCIN